VKTHLCLLLVFAQLLACSSTTLIRSSDPNAKIYLDGEYKARGSYEHTDSHVIGTETSVRLEKEGCAPAFHSFTRNERLAWVPLIFVWTIVPVLWIQGYNKEHFYEYSCEHKALIPTLSPLAGR
jgi:hypothetical protein